MPNLSAMDSTHLVEYLHQNLTHNRTLAAGDPERALETFNAIVNSQHPMENRISALLRASEIGGVRDIGMRTAVNLVEAGPQEMVAMLDEVPGVGAKTLARLVWSLAQVEDVERLFSDETAALEFLENEPTESDQALNEEVLTIPYSDMSNVELAEKLEQILGTRATLDIDADAIGRAEHNFNALMSKRLDPTVKQNVLMRITELPDTVDIGEKYAADLAALGPVERLPEVMRIKGIGDKLFSRLALSFSRIESIDHSIEETWEEMGVAWEAGLSAEEQALLDRLNELLQEDIAATLNPADIGLALENFNTIAGADYPFEQRLAALLKGTEIEDKRDIGSTLGTRLLELQQVSQLGHLELVPGMTPLYFARLVWSLTQIADVMALFDTEIEIEPLPETPIEFADVETEIELEEGDPTLGGEPGVETGPVETHLIATSGFAATPYTVNPDLISITNTDRWLSSVPADLNDISTSADLPAAALTVTSDPLGMAIIAELPRPSGWWGTVEDTADADIAPGAVADAAQPAADVVRLIKPPLIPLAPPDEDEIDILEWIWRFLRRHKRANDEEVEEELKKRRRRLRRARKRARQIRRNRERNRRRRERHQRQRDLRERRQKLNERWRDHKVERNINEGERKGLENDRDRLKQDEQDARKGPPADPNCRSSYCRGIRDQRADVNRKLTRNMKDAQQLERDGRGIRNSERDWQADNRNHQNALDRGEGMTRNQFREHVKKRKIQHKMQQIEEQRQRVDALYEKDADRGLTPSERRELDRLEQRREHRQIESLENKEHTRGLTGEEKVRLRKYRETVKQTDLERELYGRNPPTPPGYTDPSLMMDMQEAVDRTFREEFGGDVRPGEGLELRALDGMTDAELKDYEKGLDKAIGSLDDAINHVPTPGSMDAPVDTARQEFEKQMERMRDLQAEARGYQNAADGQRRALHETQKQRAEIRRKLRNLGSHNMNATAHGTPDQIREIEELRADYRRLQNAESYMHSNLEVARSRATTANDRVSRQSRLVQNAKPAQLAEDSRALVYDNHQKWKPFFDNQNKPRHAQMDGKLLEGVRNLSQWEGLNQRAKALQRAIDADKPKIPQERFRTPVPTREELQKKLTQVRGQIREVEAKLAGNGIIRQVQKVKEGGKIVEKPSFTNDPNNLIGYVTLRGISSWAREKKGQNAAQAQQVRQAQQAKGLAERDRRIRTLDNLGKQLERALGRGSEQGLGGFAKRLLRTSHTQLDNQLKRLKRERAYDVDPVGTFLKERLGVENPDQTALGVLLQDLVGAVGKNRIKAFFQRENNISREKLTEVDLLRRLFLDDLMSGSIEKGRFTEAVRHNDRYVAILTELRRRLPKESKDSDESKRINQALLEGRQALAENYRRLGDRYQRVGQVTAAKTFKGLAAHIDQLEKRQSGEWYYLENQIDRLFELSQDILGEAIASGDLARAIQITETRLAQATLMIEEAVRTDNAFVATFREKLAAEFEQLAQLQRMVAASTKNEAQKKAAEKKAARAEMLAATHYGSDWREKAFNALKRVDLKQHPEMRSWKENLLVQILASIPPAEKLFKDSYVHNIRLNVLKELFEVSNRNEVKAQSRALLAQELHRRGQTEDALKAAEEGWELQKSDAMTAVTYLTLLVDQEKTDIAKIFEVLSHVPSEIAARYDQVITLKLLLNNPTVPRLEAIHNAVLNAGFTPTRAANIQFQVKSVLARAYSREGKDTEAQALIKQALSLLNQTSFPKKKKKQLKEQLKNLSSSSTVYGRYARAFDEGKLDQGNLFELFTAAIVLDKKQVAERALKAYVEASEIEAATKYLALAGLIKSFAKQARNKKASQEAKKRATDWIDKIRSAGADIGKKELEQLQKEITHMQGEVAKADEAMVESKPNLLDGVFWFFTVGYYNQDKEHEQKQKDLSALMGRLQSLGNRVLNLQKARGEFLIAGRTGDDRRSALASETYAVDQEFNQANQAAWARARGMTDGVQEQASKEALWRHLAKLEIAERKQEAMKWIEIEEGPRLIGGDIGQPVQSMGQAELERLKFKRFGTDSSNRFDGGSKGERKRYLSLKSWKSWYEFEDRNNEFRWKHDLLRAQARRTEERMLRLIRSGPMYDEKGNKLSLGSRKSVEVQMILDEQKQLQRRYARYTSIPLASLTGAGSFEQQRLGMIAYQLKFDPSYRAIRIVGLEDKNITNEEYYMGLAQAYSAIALDHAYALQEYAEEDWYSRGIVHTFRLAMAPLFDDEDSIGFGGDLARFQKYQKEVETMTDALWVLAKKEKNRNLRLTEKQHEILVKHGFIQLNGDGTERIVPPWQADILHRKLDLPTPTVVDEVLNLKNILHLVATVLIPGGLAMGASRMVLSAEVLEGVVGGMLIRVALESAIFTSLSFPIQHALAPEGHKPNIFGAFTENFAMFMILGTVGKIGANFPAADKLFNDKQTLLRILYRGSGKTLRLSTEASIMSGLEVLTTGQDFSGRMFLRHLMTVGMLHSGNHLIGKYAPKAAQLAADAYYKWKSGVRGPERPVVDPVRAAEVGDKYLSAEQKLTESGKLEETYIGSPEQAVIKETLGKAGVTLIEVPKLPENARAQVNASPDGRTFIFVDKNTTRIDILNELSKAKNMEALEINARTGITAHEVALLEYESYRAEAELLRNQPNSARKNLSEGLRDYWGKRLKDIEAGRIPNHTLARPFEGFTLDIGLSRETVMPVFEGFLRELDIPVDYASNPRLSQLSDAAKNFVIRRREYAMRRLDELIQSASRNADHYIKLREARNQYVQDKALIKELEAKVEAADKEMHGLEAKIAEAIGEAAEISLQIRKLGEVEVTANLPDKPTYSEKWNEPGSDNAFLQKYINEYVDLWHKNAVDRKAERAAEASGNKAEKDRLHEIIKKRQTRMVEISKILGGDAAIGPTIDAINSGNLQRAFQKYFKGKKVEIVFMEEAGGGGSGELDLVLRVDGKVVVVEVKGGSSEPGSARSAMFKVRLQQASLAYILETALKMDFRGHRLIEQGKTAEGQKMIDTAAEIFNGYRTAELDSFLVKTEWAPTGDRLTIESTDIYKVEFNWNREQNPLREPFRYMNIEMPSGATENTSFRAGLVRIHTSQRVQAESNGVSARLPETMNSLLRNISQTAAAGDSTSVIMLPEAAVIIRRSGTPPGMETLVNDPALTPLKDLAVNIKQNILTGVLWVVEGGRPRNAAVLFRADGKIEFVDWDANNANQPVGMTIPTRAGDVQVTVSVCADSRSATAHDGIHLVVASCRPGNMADFMRPFSRGIGVNTAGRNLEATPLIYFEDVPMVPKNQPGE